MAFNRGTPTLELAGSTDEKVVEPAPKTLEIAYPSLKPDSDRVHGWCHSPSRVESETRPDALIRPRRTRWPPNHHHLGAIADAFVQDRRHPHCAYGCSRMRPPRRWSRAGWCHGYGRGRSRDRAPARRADWPVRRRHRSVGCGLSSFRGRSSTPAAASPANGAFG